MNQSSMPGTGPIALVIGLYGSGLAVARCLWRFGYQVVGVYWDPSEPGCHSRACARIIRRPETPAALEAYVRSLGAPGTVPVFLTFDKTLQWLRGYTPPPDSPMLLIRPDDAVFDQWMDKSAMAEDVPAALAELLQAPPSTRLGDWTDFTRRVEGPWLIKPIDAVVGERHHVPKALRVDTRDELERLAQRFEAAADQIVLQGWIPGEDDQHGFVGGYAGRDGKILVTQVGHKVAQYPQGMGVSIRSRCKPMPDLETQSRRLLELTGYRGFFEFEWKWDTRNNVWRFIELNVRAWATLALSQGYGLTLIERALRDYDLTPPLAGGWRDAEANPSEWIDDFTLIMRMMRFHGHYPLLRGAHVAHAYWYRHDPGPFWAQWRHLVRQRWARLLGHGRG
jgi:hypothetical protein